MAGISTFNFHAQIGGAMGFLDEWGETLAEKGQQAVANTGSLLADSVVDLFKQDILANPKTPKEEENKQSLPSDEGKQSLRSNDLKTQIGGKTELDFNERSSSTNKPKEVDQMKEKMRVIEFRKQFTQDEKELLAKEARKKAMAKQRENVIKTVGGISNLSYEDVMDEDGKMRLDIETWFNKKNSEMAEAELKKQKQNQVKKATGKINYFMQHNMAGERAGGQHVMSAVG